MSSEIVKIKKNFNITLSSRITNCLDPDFICVPFSRNDKLLVKEKDYIYKNQEVMSSDGIDIFSSISGVMVGIRKLDEKEYIVIKNDYKEKTERIKGIKKSFKNINKDYVIRFIRKYGSKKVNNILEDLLKEGYSSLIVNGVDSEPYVASKMFLTNKYIDEILEVIDLLNEIFIFDNSLLLIKNKEKDLILRCYESIGTYPKIRLKLINEIYPFNNPEVIKKYLYSHKKSDSYVVDVEDIFELYEILKCNRPLTNKLITITGNGVINPKVICIKNYSPINEYLRDNFKLKQGAYYYIENGLIGGKRFNPDIYFVNDQTNAIFYNSIIQNDETKCINCGACANICPKGLNPKNFKENKNCIECNLCSYVCPAKINLRK